MHVVNDLQVEAVILQWVRWRRPRLVRVRSYRPVVRAAIERHGYEIVMRAVRRYQEFRRDDNRLREAIRMIRTLTASDASWHTYRARQHRLGRPRRDAKLLGDAYQDMVRRAE